MIRPVPAAALGAGLVAALALAGCGARPLNSPATGVGCSLTVTLPVVAGRPAALATATVSGRVSALVRPTTTLPIPCGLTARLGPAAGTTGLTGWIVNGRPHPAAQVAVLIDGLTTATALVPRPAAIAAATPTPGVVTVDRWLAYDAGTRTATLQVVAGSGTANHGFNFDGQAFGALQVAVPAGWRVVVAFRNAGILPHSAALVTATGTTPVFPGAAVANPTTGVAAGGQATFSFVARAIGAYRIACLVPGHEAVGMWARFQVTAGGRPAIHL